MRIPSGCSKLDKSIIIDKIKGLIFGAILGDSLGIATEGMTREEIAGFYDQGPIRFGMDDEGVPFVRDRYRAQFDENEFGDDGEQLLLVMQAILDNEDAFNSKDFATLLSEYHQNGLRGLNKPPIGINPTNQAVLNHPEFSTNPHQAAIDVWHKHAVRGANGALIRAPILGIPLFWDGTTVIEHTTEFCKVTHPDPRCMISCVIVSTIVARMLRGQNLEVEDSEPMPLPSPPLPLPQDLKTPTSPRHFFTDTLETDSTLLALVRNVIETNKRILTAPNTDPLFRTPETDAEQTQTYYRQLLDHCYFGPFDLHKLQLDRDDQHHAFKCLAASIYAFTRHIPLHSETEYFKRIMMDLVMQGGEADTNASVAGALLGLRVGYSGLPSEWVVGLKRWEWLEDKVEEFCALL
ncbi:ADP-ribosylation/Crystallin J1 [Radiomyces spectabilis]|uniref:ADP-ribosylation/Crystallin J1 n=1 Tax=Radiomyces spectabilis TaxID=64574 RepID=UPI00221EB92B|nr:ADP-ribosylation/Crystallin J1 [Radiomyces spectabilis]KAI8374568.1 ADP-ribosylation/Crystallin J1 [Radiomyces spectabilis]